MFRKLISQPLWLQIILASIGGIICGLLLQEKAEHLKIFGTLFINLIKMVIIPLIIFSLISGITNIGSSKRASSIAYKALISFFVSALFSVSLGIMIAVIFEPGVNAVLPKLASEHVLDPNGQSIAHIIESFVSDNIIGSMAEGNIIQVIIFTIIISLTMATIPNKCSNVIKLCQEMSFIVFKVIEKIVKLGPIGVFGYLSWAVGTMGTEVIYSLGKLVITIIGGCVVQYILYGVFIKLFANLNPFQFYKKMFAAQLLAFSTGSSKAALSTTMSSLNQKLGVSKTAVNFVLPIGASINMSGGAIYLTVASIFFAQSMNVHLEFSDFIILAFTCTVGSIGAAGIPSGILLFLGMALTSIKLPTEFVVLVAGVDRIVDMFTTMINVMGDAAITTIIDKHEGTLDEYSYNS
jgi:Na+/H+-dicarboxylate symporter